MTYNLQPPSIYKYKSTPGISPKAGQNLFPADPTNPPDSPAPSF